jgi:CRISPR-associated protein Cas5d
MDATDKRQQRAAMVLKNVDYVIDAHFELTDQADPEETVEKHYNIALRRLRKGQHYHAPYLGTREFPAQVDLIENGDMPRSRLAGTRDLGWMLYDLDFGDPKDIQPHFFRAVMQDGVIDLRNVDSRR